MERSALLSPCGNYRYSLERDWSGLLPARTLVVCMLNPSTADARQDDATIRWLVGWAKKHGYGSLRVVNLAAYRATSPADMLAAGDPHGPENTEYLNRYCSDRQVLCAWGNHGAKLSRHKEMIQAMGTAQLVCLKTTKTGAPAHPLRQSHSLELTPWPPPKGRVSLLEADR